MQYKISEIDGVPLHSDVSDKKQICSEKASEADL